MRWVLWLPVQTLHVLCLLPFLLGRRGGVLVFTHDQDRDGRGRDLQMGPLVDALRARRTRLVEVSLVPAGRASLRRPGRLPWAPLAAAARVLSWLSGPAPRPEEGGGATLPEGGDGPQVSDSLRTARRRVAACLLRWVRPRLLYLVDESGSGQPLLSAARRMGIRVIGVQHGDFQPGNPQYAARPGSVIEPADVLATWSPWFQERLLRISAVYDRDRVRVTGRQRYPPEPRSQTAGTLRVVVVGGRDASRDAPFVEALEAADGIAVHVLPHPAVAGNRRDPESAFARAQVAVGSGSSALLEALWHGCTAVIVDDGPGSDPGGYVEEGVAHRVTAPAELVELCRTLGGPGGPDRSARERVWGPDPRDPVEALLALGKGAIPGLG